MTIYAPAADLWTRSVLPRVVPTPGPLDTPCWIFTGALTSRGYSSVAAGKKGRSVLGHRLAIAVRDGALPGMPVDHVCMVKACVNPAHLDVVTTAENNRRYRASRGWNKGGTCKGGHPLIDGNLRTSKRGRLVCAACATQAARERRGEAHLVRAWAKANGLPVKDTGRVSPDLVRQYRRRAAAA